MRRAAIAARFHHAVWGPDELFFGELYASQRVPCGPTLRPGTRDEYSACVGRELVERDLYDFLLFSLPDHDFHSHRLGPEASLDSIGLADRALGELVDAGGGIDAFCERHAVIVLADHAQTSVSDAIPLAEALGAEWRVLRPNDERPESAELAVGPTARAAGVYVLTESDRRARAHAELRARIGGLEGVDLVTWLCSSDGTPLERERAGAPTAGLEVAVRAGAAELRFRPGSQLVDRRGNRWDLDGELSALAASEADGRFESDVYPNALERLWAALNAPHAPDLLASAERGYEFVDWGRTTHIPGGSHGALERGDSLGPLLLVGLDEAIVPEREQWTLRDVAGLVLGHFGIGEPGAVDAGALEPESPRRPA
jgi:hypothetical protein